MAKKRIAYARINQETNCLSPVLTTMADFRRCHFIEGRDLAHACDPWGYEVKGFVRQAELTGFVDALREDGDAEPVPIFSAWAVASGPLDLPTIDELAGRLREGLRAAGPIDGVLLCLHGAMGADKTSDPDTVLVRAAREGAGAGVPIVVTHDLHGNLTQDRVDLCDAIVAYRTNPHRDHRRTGYVAARTLLRKLRGQASPVTAWRSLPMILGGGATIDFLPPVRSVFTRLTALHRDRRILSASTFMCHPWNDDPRLGWSTIVTTDGDRSLAEDLADELAERCWAVRHEPAPRFASASEAIHDAREARMARRLGVVVMADASDVVTAGAPGENTRLLAALLDEGRDLVSYVPLRDPEVVEALWARPEGSFVRASVGGKLDPAHGDSLAIEGRLLRKLDHHALGRMISLDLGPVKLVITEGHALAMKPAFYNDIGLDAWKPDVVVVKNFFPFRLYFAPMARKTIYVRTEGVTDLDASFALQHDGPVWPKDDVKSWREADRRRRASARVA